MNTKSKTLAALVWLAAALAHAGRDAWSSVGPFGASIGAIAVDPTNPAIVYAGTDGDFGLYPPHRSGLFKSVDGGNRWTFVGSDLTGEGSIQSVAVDPSDPQTIYAGSQYQGVLKSSDGGTSWHATNTNLPGPPPGCAGGQSDCDVNVVVVDPSTRDVYAGTASGLFKSADGANTWSLVEPDGYPSDFVSAIVFDPSHTSTIYVGTSLGLYKTQDAGATWNPANGGLVEPDIAGLVIDPSDPSILFATASDRGTFRITEGGETWHPLDAPAGATIRAIDPADAQTLYAAFRPGEIVVAGAAGPSGIYRSRDGGGTWQEIGDRRLDGGAATIVPLATPNGAVWLGTGTGIFESADSGATWEARNRDIDGVAVTALAVAGSSAVYAASNAYRGAIGAGWISEIGGSGRAWTILPDSVGGFAATGLAIDPRNPDTVYAAVGGSLLKSTDAGRTWILSGKNAAGDEGYFTLVAVDPAQPDTLYSVATGGGANVSTDGGNTWTFGSTGISPSHLGHPYFTSLIADPLSSGTVYASGDFGIIKSTDLGATWTPIDGDLAPVGVAALAVDPVHRSVLYAGRSDGIDKSVDGGESWSKTGGIGATFSTRAIALDPGNPLKVVAGGDAGIIFSADGGETWSAFDSGLPVPLSILALAVDPSARTVYAGTSRGVFGFTSVSIPVSAPATPGILSRR